MRKILITISLLFTLQTVKAYEEDTEVYSLPELPKPDLDSINNEMLDYNQKERAPSNAYAKENDEYIEADKPVSTWDYQNVIDRYDNH